MDRGRPRRHPRRVQRLGRRGQRRGHLSLVGQGPEQFKAFVPDGALVWGNGADFDNPILATAYGALNQVQPWKPYNGHCYRTLKSLVKGPKIERTGTHHNAVDDARSQALHAIQLLRVLK